MTDHFPDDIDIMRLPLFTIFTPSYNRAHTLPRVYESIAAQTFRDFEWVVVDDGSTDNSAELVEAWAHEACFPIRYFHQPNGHKKTAFNRGVREAQGDLFLCLDSDDAMPPDALQKFRDAWFAIPDDQRDGFAGVAGLCIDQNGKVVGDRFPAAPLDGDDLALRFKLGVEGEKWGFHRRDILERFPYPEFIPGFVVEGVVWNAIAREYQTRYINEVVRIYYPEENSLVNSMKTLSKLRGIAEGTSYAYREFIDQDWKWFAFAPLKLLKIAANQTRFTWHLWRSGSGVAYYPATVPGKILRAVSWPIGFGIFLYDELFLPTS